MAFSPFNEFTDFSATAVYEALYEELSADRRNRLRQAIKDENGEKELLSLSDSEFDAALHLTEIRGGIPVPTVAGILLEGKDEAVERFLPSSGIHVRVVSDFRTELDEQLGGTIPEMIDRMREIFRQNNGKGSARPEITDFSLESLDELLFNALIHRDYTMGVPTEILVDPEGVEITSPGMLFNQSSPEKLLYANSISRNPVLGRALKMLGFCTMNGNGVREIFYSALKYGRPEPDYSQSSEKQVSVFLHRIQPDLALSSLIEKVLSNGSRLSVTALRVLYQLRRTPLTAEEIAERLSLSSGGRLVVVLENLLSLKLAEFTEGGRYQIMWPAADDDI